MKYAQIIETLTATPLLIAPAAADALRKMFDQHATMSAEEFKAAREGVGPCGEKVELEQMTINDGIASIPINGPLGIRLGKMEKGAGAVDYLDIMTDLKTADADPTVENILLYFDSPGGMSAGLPECIDAIENCTKPVYAFVPPGASCASAAYALATQCNGIFACPSASIGSIGVYCVYSDLSAMAELKGIKIKVFTSGIYKGMGVPGTSLTPDQEQLLQKQVIALAEWFYDQVSECRNGNVDDDVMQGQSFKAAEAVENGLIDDVVADEETIRGFLTSQ